MYMMQICLKAHLYMGMDAEAAGTWVFASGDPLENPGPTPEYIIIVIKSFEFKSFLSKK